LEVFSGMMERIFMGNKIQVLFDGRMVADEVIYADTPQLKKKGVLGKKDLKRNE